MSKTIKILVAICLIALLAFIIHDPVLEYLSRPSTPEATFDYIITGRPHRRMFLLYQEEFPLDSLFEHLSDERTMRSVQAVRGPYRVWMLCQLVLENRLGLGKNPEIREKWLIPLPDEFTSRDTLKAWWDQQTEKDELTIRLRLATWQLGEMEKNPKHYEVHLDFKRRQIAETAARLAER